MSASGDRIRFPTASGVLSYTSEGHGAPVVCVPGGPGIDPWTYFAQLRLPGVRQLTLAPRGTGDSTPPPAPDDYRLAGYVADVEALREHLGEDRLTLYGASHGGSVALAYALDHPERVERLVLCAPPTRMDDAFREAVAEARHRFADAVWDGRERLATADAAAAAMEQELTEPERRRHLRVMFSRYVAHQGPEQAAYLDGICAGPLNWAAPPVMFAEMRSGMDLLTDAHRIAAPALVISGALDVVVPASRSRALAEALPGGRYVELPDAGHFAEVDAPAAFGDQVGAFLHPTSTQPPR